MNRFKCDVTHQDISFDACISCSAKGQAKLLGCLHSPDVLRGIKQSVLSRDLKEISITELLDCPRALFLKKKIDYGCKPSRLYWLYRGQMIHRILELGALDGDIVEKRMHAILAGYPVSGKPDLIRGETIYDYKTTALVPDAPREQDILQISMYRFLASLQDPPMIINKGMITYLDMKTHKQYPVSLHAIDTTRRMMIDLIVARNIQINREEAPTFADHFSHNNWRCGRTEESSFCLVRRECTHLQGEPDTKTKKRTIHQTK